jgi:cytochrome c peroxidase
MSINKFLINRIYAFIAMLFLFSACSKDPILTNPVPQNVELDFPTYFPKPHYEFIVNTLSKDRIILGKELFYDPILSSDSTISCASCHQQNVAFSDENKKFSFGVNHQIGTRNSPPIFNMIWNTSFMWDGGINHIEIMPFAPITVANEMNEDMKNVIEKLKRSAKYSLLFRNAYGENQISDKHLLYALTQFMGTIISSNSKYDEVKKGKIAFSSLENEGYEVFKTKCNSCHTEPLFTNYSFENNGIDTFFTDIGRQRITLDSNDAGKFKVPTLRNINLTMPYMHDGRFSSIDDVLQHYSHGIKYSKTLSTNLSNVFTLTINEKNAIKAFLNTLNDEKLINNSDLKK